MATSIWAFARSCEVPTFAQVTEVATDELHRFLSRNNIVASPTYQVRWWVREQVYELVDPGQQAVWMPQVSAWFELSGFAGGTIIRFYDHPEWAREYLENALDTEPAFQAKEKYIRACMMDGRVWEANRYGGPSAVANISYGIIAASFAWLTSGLLHSDDGAWDYQRFPVTPAEFLSWWYDPEQALVPSNKTWARKCIEAVRFGKDNPNDIVITEKG